MSKYIQDSKDIYQECGDLGIEIEAKARNLQASFETISEAWSKLTKL
jgi:hypothetical protein